MPDNSFDVVSKIELPEVSNAVQQALKEIHTRYDLKDSKSSIELNEKEHKILLASQDDYKLKAIIEVLEGKLVKRKVPLKGLTYGSIIPAAGSTVRQEISLQQGIPIEKAREIVRSIKDSKLKVQASIQGDLVGERAGPRHPPDGDQAAPRHRLRHRHAVHQLPDQLGSGAAYRIAPVGRPSRAAGGPVGGTGRPGAGGGRRGLPSAPALRGHHAEQSGLPAGTGPAEIRIGGTAFQLSRSRPQRGRTCARGGRGGRCAGSLSLAASSLSPAAVLPGRFFVRLACDPAPGLRVRRRRAADRRRLPDPGRRLALSGNLSGA